MSKVIKIIISKTPDCPFLVDSDACALFKTKKSKTALCYGIDFAQCPLNEAASVIVRKK